MDPLIAAALASLIKLSDDLVCFATVAIQGMTEEQRVKVWDDVIARHAEHEAARQKLLAFLHLPGGPA